jgi:replicative DNA helicase
MLSDHVAERASVAGACRGRDHYLDVCDVLRADSFTDPANAALWQCVASVYEDEKPPERVDVATLMSVANAKGFSFLFEKKGEAEHVRRVLDMDLDELSVRKMAAKVRKLHIARQAAERVRGVERSLQGLTGNESMDAILACLEGPILDFSGSIQGEDGDIKRLGERAEEYVEYKLANPVERLGVPTGFPLYDDFIGGGIRPNSVNVIAARLKVGKSFMSVNVGVNVAYRGVPVLLLDTEMSEEEQLDRVLARIAEIPTRLIEKGVPNHTADQRRKLLEAARRLKDMPIDYKVIRGMEFEEVLALARRWIFKKVGFLPDGKAKPCVVVYDYLKLMDDKPISRHQAEYQALGFMTTALKNFVGRYHVGSLVGAQTNREGIDGVGSGVVAGSDRIGWFCTSLAQYVWKTPEEQAELAHVKAQHYTHKLIPSETRWGEKYDSGDYINVHAEYKYGRMREGPRAFELSQRLLKGDDEAGKGFTPQPGEGGHVVPFA